MCDGDGARDSGRQGPQGGRGPWVGKPSKIISGDTRSNSENFGVEILFLEFILEILHETKHNANNKNKLVALIING